MKRVISVILILSLCLLCGCTKIEPKPAEPETTTEKELSEAEKLLADMTTEEKVAQLFFVRADCLDESKTAEELLDPNAEGIKSVSDEMKAFYGKYPVGGFVIFAKNIEKPDQLKELTAQLHSLNEITPFISIDEEGGRISRIAANENFDVERFDSMESIAATGKPARAYNVGLTIGKYLKDYGVDIDLAPVADINTNPKNRVIGNRAFGGNPNVAADMVSSAVSGFHDAGTYCTLKHFPGHGDTTNDTHYGLATADRTWDEMLNRELVPFIAGINAGADIIMVAHISCPKVTGDMMPADLSAALVTDKLRGELGWNGLVATDDLSMGAITELFSPAEASVLAVNAGCDMLLLSSHLPEAYAGVLDAVQSGKISMERLDESVLRILELKLK